jgi:predicted NAD/FAD-dependent oxidoreductase
MVALPRAAEVVVIGAGLAGLCAARHLVAAGREVVVVEAADGVGGRVRTDLVDGLRLDRGFQLFNPSYPEARRMLDLEALALRSFVPGVVVAADGRRHRLADPVRVPGWAPSSVRAPVGGLGDKVRFLAYVLRAARADPGRLTGQDDGSARQALRDAGLSDRFVDTVLRPFLAGVFLEDDLATSRRYLDLVVRSFARGTPAVPAAGMQAIPDQLAAGLPPGAVVLDTPVRAVGRGRVETEDGTIGARAVVVATEAPAAAELLAVATTGANGVAGDDGRAAAAEVAGCGGRSVTTWYHVADVPAEAVTDGQPVLTVDGGHRGPLVNTVAISHAAPTYATDGRVLVSSSALGLHGDDVEPAVRDHLAALYGVPTRGWAHVATYPIAHALPAMPPPHDFRRPVAVGEGLFVCGDHRDSASIQGAMVSGRRAAEAVRAWLGVAERA